MLRYLRICHTAYSTGHSIALSLSLNGSALHSLSVSDSPSASLSVSPFSGVALAVAALSRCTLDGLGARGTRTVQLWIVRAAKYYMQMHMQKQNAHAHDTWACGQADMRVFADMQASTVCAPRVLLPPWPAGVQPRNCSLRPATRMARKCASRADGKDSAALYNMGCRLLEDLSVAHRRAAVRRKYDQYLILASAKPMPEAWMVYAAAVYHAPVARSLYRWWHTAGSTACPATMAAVRSWPSPRSGRSPPA